MSKVPLCDLCRAPAGVLSFIENLRELGWGYKRIWRALQEEGLPYSRDLVQIHQAHQMRNVMSAIGDAEDQGIEKDVDWFTERGIDLPPGFVAGTIEERGPNGEKHWLRTKPVTEDIPENRIEIRQATPINLQFITPPIFWKQGNWQTWITNPDVQMGYWLDDEFNIHTTHDERCLDLSHQIGVAVAESEGVHGWLDVGDFADLQAPSRHNPTKIDLNVTCLNKTFERGSQVMATRRMIVGPEGELLFLEGNHDLRFAKKNAQEQPYLVGLKRAGILKMSIQF